MLIGAPRSARSVPAGTPFEVGAGDPAPGFQINNQNKTFLSSLRYVFPTVFSPAESTLASRVFRVAPLRLSRPTSLVDLYQSFSGINTPATNCLHLTSRRLSHDVVLVPIMIRVFGRV